jgi:hydroxyethylthiazole kinase-like uncharacterized protein yjeF
MRIDDSWRAAHPLPVHGAGTDKNSRGRVLAVGGTSRVPGALRLTGEAALRAGAGKLQMATVASVAPLLGVTVPEAAVIALPETNMGEIAPAAAGQLLESVRGCDTLVLGPGMYDGESAEHLVSGLMAAPCPELSVVLDAGAVVAAGGAAALIAGHGGRVVMTPHHGEMAALTGADKGAIDADPDAHALQAARRFGAVVVLKNSRTVIASPEGALLDYASDCVGLATGGSGDVLAGIIGGLMARGADPLEAAAWGVWLHGEAGQRVSARVGPMGFLARDLVPEIPGLMVGG